MFNKSAIFKAAWTAVKTTGCTIAQGLRQAWAAAKAPANKIGEWFIAGESEKALNIQFFVSDVYGKKQLMEWKSWVPKSVITGGQIAAWKLAKVLEEAGRYYGMARAEFDNF